jgi:ABC-type antimicrobial peptide transport system permease subunit
MVLDDTAARELFGARDPIGQLVHAHSPTDQDFTVVGIVQSARSRAPDETSRPIAYYAQAPTDPPASAGFLVRASDPAAIAPLVQSVAASVLAPGSAKPEVYVVDDAFRTLTEPRRFNAALMSALGLFALAIGAAGIYAVMASIVAQQTKEIGVRVALGATARDIRRGVLVRTGRYVTAGLVLGLPAGWLIARSFASEFFEVTPSDTSIYLIVAATLGAVAFVAAIVPARRAARVDPVVSLRAS